MATMTKETLTSVAITLIVAVLGAWLYYRFFYTGNRRKPAYVSRHSLAPGRTPIVWIDWEERHGDRIMRFGAAL